MSTSNARPAAPLSSPAPIRATAPPNPRTLVLIDGHCGICGAAARWIRRRDRARRFVIAPYQEQPLTALAAWGTSPEQCSRSMHVVTPNGRVYRGALALTAIWWRLPGWRWVAVVSLALPPLLVVEAIAYRIVAANRRALSRWLGLSACYVDVSEAIDTGAGALRSE